MDTIHYVLLAIAVFNLVLGGMPFVRSDYWTFRVFDFPRLQKLVFSAATLILMLCYPTHNKYYYVIMGLLAVHCIYLVKIILPYTPLHKKWVKPVDKTDDENCISLVVSNVYQDNDNYRGCLAMLASANPDIVLLLETDAAWANGVKELKNSYPYHLLVPQENTYGMLFFSKLPIRNSEVHFLVEDDIPSIFCQVQLPSQQWVQLYCLHPTPPSPTENPRSTERDQELLLIAELAKKQSLPVIVLGDLNDVAWSYTTELFLKMSGLLDPRIGRGFYNSFNAKTRIMRFPLDHVFVSKHFRHVSIRRLGNFDSDHFPIYGKYQYSKEAARDQEELTPDKEDRQVAREKRNAV